MTTTRGGNKLLRLLALFYLVFSRLRCASSFVFQVRGSSIASITVNSVLLAEIVPSSRHLRHHNLSPSTTKRNAVWMKPNSFALASIGVSGGGDDAVSATTNRKLDVGALIKYVTAIGVQLSLYALLFSGLDAVIAASRIQVPIWLNFPLFYFLALKSRVFNPLNNQRPKVTGTGKGFGDRKMPKFTPPVFIFPIVWLLIVGPLRALTSALVYRESGRYASSAILSLIVHLSIGDVWNTINNTERRYGTSAAVILLVAFSKAWASYQYYLVSPIAGKLLALTLIWFGIAGTLIWETWRLNPVDGSQLDTLYPNQDAPIPTKFAWFAKKEE